MVVLAGIEVNMAVVWLVAMIALLVIEGVVPGLISIWFAIGALAALLAALFGAPLWLQTAWFLIVSVAALCLTRPLAKKYINSKVQPTNADMMIGKECLVTKDIDNMLGTGEAVVSGRVWTARSEADGVKLPSGRVAFVKRIEGVKLIVSAAGDVK